ncbi:MAG: ParB family transcriptional regulator, chromosome partitioning protein, partial [Frankiales bacterium]|nr:ParB family transcriptional regulator, chromosome partitioning protein [Frankiales bacterium]
EELVTLNETGASPKSSRRQVRPHAPALASLASRLSDHFETRVKVELGRSKGKITLEFASVDDLERIVAAMAPAAATALDETPVG